MNKIVKFILLYFTWFLESRILYSLLQLLLKAKILVGKTILKYKNKISYGKKFRPAINIKITVSNTVYLYSMQIVLQVQQCNLIVLYAALT